MCPIYIAAFTILFIFALRQFYYVVSPCSLHCYLSFLEFTELLESINLYSSPNVYSKDVLYPGGWRSILIKVYPPTWHFSCVLKRPSDALSGWQLFVGTICNTMEPMVLGQLLHLLCSKVGSWLDGMLLGSMTMVKSSVSLHMLVLAEALWTGKVNP